MLNCCRRNKDTKMMSDTEASLRAKLLVKCAEFADLKHKYEKLAEDFFKLQSELNETKVKQEEYLDNIDDMHLQMQYYAGKLSVYKDIIGLVLDV